MDYEKLKEVIAKKIKENGREEITGPVLQMVLMAMVDSLGEVYPQTYTEEQKAQARANIDALSDYDGAITKEKLSAEVQAILDDVANKQNISDESLATIAKTIVEAINEVYNGGLKDASIATSKIEDGAVTEPKLGTDLVNVITSAVQPAELASAIATALASYVAKADILDTTGSAMDKVMSQHGVTEAINGVTNKVTELESKIGGEILNIEHVGEPSRSEFVNFIFLKGGKYIFHNLGSECSLNLRRKDGTEKIVTTGIASNSSVSFECNENYIGIRSYVVGELYKFTISTQDGLSKEIQMLYSKEQSLNAETNRIANVLDNRTCSFAIVKDFKGEHSSESDRCRFSLKKYDFITFNAESNIEASFGLYAFKKDGNKIQLGTFSTNHNYELIVPFDLEYLSVYFYFPSSGFLTLNIETPYKNVSIRDYDANVFGKVIEYYDIVQAGESIKVVIPFEKDCIYTFKNLGDLCTLNLFDINGVEKTISSGLLTNESVTFVCDKDYQGVRCYEAGTKSNFYIIKNNSVMEAIRLSTDGIVAEKNISVNADTSVNVSCRFNKGETYIFYNYGTTCTINLKKYDGTEVNVSSGVAKGDSCEFTCEDNYCGVRCYEAGNEAHFIIITKSSARFLIDKSISTFKDRTFMCNYNEDDDESKIDSFCQLLGNTDSSEVEAFVYFSDPHLMYRALVTNEIVEKSINRIQKIYNYTPTDFVLCAGDWLEADTKAVAKRQLGYVDAIANTAFRDNYYCAFGNHDNNYQGWESDSNTTPRTGTLDKNVVTNLWYRKYGRNYYHFRTAQGLMFVFDSGTDGYNTMDEYRWEQVNWFAQSLLSEKPKHALVCMHIVNASQPAETWDDGVTDMAKEISMIAKAYNSKSSINVQGTTFDYSSISVGTVHCILCGHTHYDYNTVLNTIPVFCITNLLEGYSREIGFDLVFIDYKNKKLKSIRIGRGSNRDIDIV